MGRSLSYYGEHSAQSSWNMGQRYWYSFYGPQTGMFTRRYSVCTSKGCGVSELFRGKPIERLGQSLPFVHAMGDRELRIFDRQIFLERIRNLRWSKFRGSCIIQSTLRQGLLEWWIPECEWNSSGPLGTVLAIKNWELDKVSMALPKNFMLWEKLRCGQWLF